MVKPIKIHTFSVSTDKTELWQSRTQSIGVKIVFAF